MQEGMLLAVVGITRETNYLTCFVLCVVVNMVADGEQGSLLYKYGAAKVSDTMDYVEWKR